MGYFVRVTSLFNVLEVFKKRLKVREGWGRGHGIVKARLREK